MRRWPLIVPVIILLTTACQNNNRIPSNVLSKEKMQAVIWDLIRADEFLNNFKLPKDSSLNRKEESLKLYQQVFNIHQITREKFQESFSFYRTHPAILKTVLDSVSKNKINAIEAAIPGKTDTLERVNKSRRIKVQ